MLAFLFFIHEFRNTSILILIVHCFRNYSIFKHIKYFFIVLIALQSSFTLAANKTIVNVYAYHLKPPFIINLDKKEGLYYDFVDYLNRNSDKYAFKFNFIPRKRVELLLENNTLDGILIGVNPVWFKDKSETKYLWSSRFLTDRDDVVSHATKPVEYGNNQALIGKVFGGVRGYYYYGISELIKEGKITRQDTIGEPELLSMLLLKRVDAIIISNSTFSYLTLNGFDPKFFHISKKPHDMFERRVLVPLAMKDIYSDIENLVLKSTADTEWQTAIQQYN